MSHFLTASIFSTLALDRLNLSVAAFTNRVKGYHKIYSKIQKKKSCQETRSRGEGEKDKRGSYPLK